MHSRAELTARDMTVEERIDKEVTCLLAEEWNIRNVSVVLRYREVIES